MAHFMVSAASGRRRSQPWSGRSAAADGGPDAGRDGGDAGRRARRRGKRCGMQMRCGTQTDGADGPRAGCLVGRPLLCQVGDTTGDQPVFSRRSGTPAARLAEAGAVHVPATGRGGRAGPGGAWSPAGGEAGPVRHARRLCKRAHEYSLVLVRVCADRLCCTPQATGGPPPLGSSRMPLRRPLTGARDGPRRLHPGAGRRHWLTPGQPPAPPRTEPPVPVHTCTRIGHVNRLCGAAVAVAVAVHQRTCAA